MKQIIIHTIQIFFCFIILVKGNAQEIRLLNSAKSEPADIFDNITISLNYNFSMINPTSKYDCTEDTLQLKVTFKDGKSQSAYFTPNLNSGGLKEIPSTKTIQFGLNEHLNNYSQNGDLSAYITVDYLSTFKSLCSAQIFIKSKTKGRTFFSGIYNINTCDLNYIDIPLKKSYQFWREDYDSIKVYGVTEPINFQFYSIMGDLVPHLIISEGQGFLNVELAKKCYPVIVVCDGLKRKI